MQRTKSYNGRGCTAMHMGFYLNFLRLLYDIRFRYDACIIHLSIGRLFLTWPHVTTYALSVGTLFTQNFSINYPVYYIYSCTSSINVGLPCIQGSKPPYAPALLIIVFLKEKWILEWAKFYLPAIRYIFKRNIAIKSKNFHNIFRI